MWTQSVDAVIVGSGACGGLVAKELAEQGFSVIVVEAGKRFEPSVDLANSESNGAKIQWNEQRVYTGDRVIPKTGIGVGASLSYRRMR